MNEVLYPTDLTDEEWAYLEALLPVFLEGRPRTWSLRLLLNAVFYLLRSGCAWRLLPREYPPWQTVYSTFRRWRLDGTWEKVHTALREQVRTRMDRDACPSVVIIDSQSVKTTEKGGQKARTPSAMMDIRRSKGVNATSSWTPKAWCWASL